MLIIMKERGDVSRMLGILKYHDDDTIEIVKHPNLPEGQVFSKSTLSHLINSVKDEYDERERKRNA